MSYRFYLTFAITVFIVFATAILWPPSTPVTPHIPSDLWSVRSIDTMKYSRDLAREKTSDASFDAIISEQVSNIAGTGATHVAIATPYDEEFVPFMTRWVNSARSYGLKVWFRGNLSGWEGWFDYKKISRTAHTLGVTEFIRAHASLFKNGDIFTSCPECENGGQGDPRQTGDVEGYRQFLIDEHRAVNAAFRSAGKNVTVGYPSMNYDVAKLIMDKNTTAELGGIVAIDHYVKDPKQIAQDVAYIAKESGGKVFLGEFGTPIPDIHGNLNQDEQATWVRTALAALEHTPELVGLNYWVAVGGSTELWSKGEARPVVKVISEFFHKKI